MQHLMEQKRSRKMLNPEEDEDTLQSENDDVWPASNRVKISLPFIGLSIHQKACGVKLQ